MILNLINHIKLTTINNNLQIINKIHIKMKIIFTNKIMNKLISIKHK